MQATVSSTIEREIHIEAPPETVYGYFVDPAKMTHWMAMKAESDPRPGGALRWDMNGFDIARGEYLELVPYSRIVFTWGWESLADSPRPGTTTIEVTLRAERGGTVLTLVHRGLTEETAPAHAGGWDYFLPRLAQASATTWPAEPAAELLSEPAELARRLNTLLCHLRDLLEDAEDSLLARRTPGSAWPAGVVASHAISHLQLVPFAVEVANGKRTALAGITLDQLNANNARLKEMAPPPRDQLITDLREKGPAAVESLKSLVPESLGNSQPMAFAGDAQRTARDLISSIILGDMADHIKDVEAAIT